MSRNYILKKLKKLKKRNWAFIIYPDSLPYNWKEILTNTSLKCAISPLHCDNYNDTDELQAKPHYHVIVCYYGPTTYSNVKNLTIILNATNPQPLESITSYYRYFTHKDNPEKAQYDDNDIQCINGFDINDYVKLTTKEREEKIKEVEDFICKNRLLYYSDCIIQIKLKSSDLYSIFIKYRSHFKSFLDSRKDINSHERKNSYRWHYRYSIYDYYDDGDEDDESK